jgi:hypothetical protein
MRYLRVVILVTIFGFGLNMTVFGQICWPGRMRAGRQPLRDDWSEPENLQVRPMLSRFAGPRWRERRRRAGSHIH